MSHFWIYMHINKKNGKRYVGITTQDTPEMRWHGGSGYLNGNQPLFARAIKKYGWDGFDHIATLCDSMEELLFLEQFYIKFYDSRNPSRGYNISGGGEHPVMDDRTKQKLSDSMNNRYQSGWINPMQGVTRTEDWRLEHSMRMAKIFSNPEYRKADSERMKIAYANPKNTPMYGKAHRVDARKAISESRRGNSYGSRDAEFIKKMSRAVLCYTKKGIFVGEFSSISEAARKFDCCVPNIVDCCNGGKHKSVHGYVFKYKDDYTPFSNKKIDSTKLLQLTDDGRIVAMWNSAKEAEEKSRGIYKRSGISQCINGKVYHAYGYVWKYA